MKITPYQYRTQQTHMHDDAPVISYTEHPTWTLASCLQTLPSKLSALRSAGQSHVTSDVTGTCSTCSAAVTRRPWPRRAQRWTAGSSDWRHRAPRCKQTDPWQRACTADVIRAWTERGLALWSSHTAVCRHLADAISPSCCRWRSCCRRRQDVCSQCTRPAGPDSECSRRTLVARLNETRRQNAGKTL